MGLLTSGAFATGLLSVLLIYYSVISLEASEDFSSNAASEDFSSNEVYFEIFFAQCTGWFL